MNNNINNLSELTLCELKNLLYINNKNNSLDKNTIQIINELIDYKIKKSRVKNNDDIDPIKKITSLLIENNQNDDLCDIDNSDSDMSNNDDMYNSHNKYKNSKKIRNEEFTQTSQKLLNRLLGEADFRYQDKKTTVIKPYSTQDKEINTNLGRRKNIF
jgi:hypothetical protein